MSPQHLRLQPQPPRMSSAHDVQHYMAGSHVIMHKTSGSTSTSSKCIDLSGASLCCEVFVPVPSKLLTTAYWMLH